MIGAASPSASLARAMTLSNARLMLRVPPPVVSASTWRRLPPTKLRWNWKTWRSNSSLERPALQGRRAELGRRAQGAPPPAVPLPGRVGARVPGREERVGVALVLPRGMPPSAVAHATMPS